MSDAERKRRRYLARSADFFMELERNGWDGEDLDHRNMSDEEARAILDEEGIDPDAAYDRLMAKVREQEGGTDGKA